MRSLGIDPDYPKCNGRVSEEEAEQWHYIQQTLLQHKEWRMTVAENYVQVNSLRETQTCTQQARQVGQLTILGTVFVLLSIISGILSMGGNSLPGMGKFWVYLAIAFPVATLLMLCPLINLLPYLWSWVTWVWYFRKRYMITHDRKEHGLLPRFHVLPIKTREGMA